MAWHGQHVALSLLVFSVLGHQLAGLGANEKSRNTQHNVLRPLFAVTSPNARSILSPIFSFLHVGYRPLPTHHNTCSKELVFSFILHKKNTTLAPQGVKQFEFD